MTLYTHQFCVLSVQILKFSNIIIVGAPLAPSSVSIGGILSSTDSELSVNLTWSPSHCVMVYYVEVTATNINFTNTTTSQHITLTLQIGVEYSFRVRGADTINRLGEWSDPFVYSYQPPAGQKFSNSHIIYIINISCNVCA